MKDVVIIGAGISGITAALYLKRANKDVLLIEKGMVGGIINKTSSINNYPTISNITGPDFSNLLLDQLMSNNIDIRFATVISVENEENKKIVRLKNETIECKYVILATGKENRRLGVPMEEELSGHGVSYCALCDGPLYKDKDVAVIGTGTAALEEALYLADICKKVTILAKYDYFKAEEALVNDVKKKANIKVLYSSMVTRFVGKDNKLISLEYVHNNKKSKLKVEGAFIYIGSTPNVFSELKLELENNFIKVNDKMETSVKGIYAVGDVIKKDVYQLVTATNDGAVAANNIIKELNKK